MKEVMRSVFAAAYVQAVFEKKTVHTALGIACDVAQNYFKTMEEMKSELNDEEREVLGALGLFIEVPIAAADESKKAALFKKDKYNLEHFMYQELGPVSQAIRLALTERPDGGGACVFWFNDTPALMLRDDTEATLYMRWLNWRIEQKRWAVLAEDRPTRTEVSDG